MFDLYHLGEKKTQLGAKLEPEFVALVEIPLHFCNQDVNKGPTKTNVSSIEAKKQATTLYFHINTTLTSHSTRR